MREQGLRRRLYTEEPLELFLYWTVEIADTGQKSGHAQQFSHPS